jgi:hypothetical protein
LFAALYAHSSIHQVNQTLLIIYVRLSFPSFLFSFSMQANEVEKRGKISDIEYFMIFEGT